MKLFIDKVVFKVVLDVAPVIPLVFLSPPSNIMTPPSYLAFLSN